LSPTWPIAVSISTNCKAFGVRRQTELGRRAKPWDAAP
jgi:hypothetical protein